MCRVIRQLGLFFVGLHLQCAMSLAGDVFPEGFFDNEYIVIGKMPDGGQLYEGTATIRSEGGALSMVRLVNGERTLAKGRLSPAASGDANVLRFRFRTGDVNYEATYLIGSDLDNQPRLTGHIYRYRGSTTRVGVEALFAQPGQPGN